MIKRRGKDTDLLDDLDPISLQAAAIKAKHPRIKVSSAKAKSRRCQDWTAAKISDLIGLPWGKDQPI